MSHVIRELQIKTALRGHYKPIRMANIQTLTTPNAGKDVKQQELSFISGGIAKSQVTLESSLAVSYNTKHTLTM